MKKSTVIIVWGVITAIANAIFYQLIDVTDNPNRGIQYISYLIIFAGLLVGTLQYRKANEGFLSFGEGYKAGILMTLIIAVLSAVNLAIFLQMHPDFINKIIARSQAEMVNKGMTSEQMDMAMNYTKKFVQPPFMILFAFLGGVISGAIMSLLSSGIALKKKPMFEENTTDTIE